MSSWLISVESAGGTERHQRTIPREDVVSLDRSTRDLLIGTCLGDGYLEPHGKGVRLEVVHSVRQRSYAEWKWKQLAIIGCSPMHYCSAAYPFWRFVTKSHPYIGRLRTVFYRDGKKRVPDNIVELLQTPLALAVWFMDDGTRDQRHHSMFFETQGFDREGNEKLQGCLERNFGLRTTITSGGRNRGLRLYVPVRTARRLSQLVSPFVVADLRYKLTTIPVTTEDESPR